MSKEQKILRDSQPPETTITYAHADLADIRHDLKTPVNAIVMYSEMLLEDAEAEGQEKLVPDLQRILAAGKSLVALIDKLLVTEHQEEATPPDWHTRSMEEHANLPSYKSPVVTEGLTERGHLLVVDDNENNRDVLHRILQRQGHTVASAENGRKALEMLQQEKFDLVLLDILMPEMDGFQTLQQIKQAKEFSHIPVIMLSALNDLESVVRCVEMGAEDYLPKPFNQVLLRARIGASLEKKRLRDLEIDYLRNVESVTDAAAAVEAGQFDPHSLDQVTTRNDELGQLARVFQKMGREVLAREERLREQVQQLRIQIDERRREKQVAEITESDYFQELQKKAKELRDKRR